VPLANQANGLATNGNIYEIENIRVSVGGPIPTEYRPYALDLAHCLRYYEENELSIPRVISKAVMLKQFTFLYRKESRRQ
jgi:hypothetical protein